MTRQWSRRYVLKTAAAAALLGPGFLASRTAAEEVSDALTASRGFSELRAAVHRDYVEGRLAIVDGWIMSQHERDRML